MASSEQFYELSDEADQDIEEIFDFTESNFGFDQAVEYLSKLEGVINQLVENPEIGRTRNEIKVGLRSFPKSSHVIFYRILTDRIRIVRVIHGSKDLPNFLK
ncbi:MAG: toxin ParE1/3/4 [Cyclobacteriaceae bacterium]|jgi:toxin ParE1/3/4